MPDISQITLPSGSVYNIKDAKARADIEALSGYSTYLGVTTTALTDGATTNPIVIGGESVTAKKGGIANFGSKEFIFNGTAWQEFGDMSALGDLAYKDSASGSYTPEGTVEAPVITVTPNTDSVSGMDSVGALPNFTATVANEVLTFGWDAGSLPTKSTAQTFVTGISSATASNPTFTGTAKNVTVS